MARPMLVLGSMKAGTTTLHAILHRHPEVEIVTEKEANSFHDAALAATVAKRIHRSPRAVAGEVSAGYLQAPRVGQPVATVLDTLGPETRLMAILREPFARAVSHWGHWVALGSEQRSCEEALLRPDSPYVAFSRYAAQLEPWVRAFGAERMCILRLEDYVEDPDSFLGQIWNHLGIEPPAESLTSMHENAQAERVARGLAGRFARSDLYRRYLRRAVPTSLRNRARDLSTTARTAPVEPDITSGLRDAFYERLQDDPAMLADMWPRLNWSAS